MEKEGDVSWFGPDGLTWKEAAALLRVATDKVESGIGEVDVSLTFESGVPIYEVRVRWAKTDELPQP